MARPVSNSEVAAYSPVCTALAWRYNGRGGAEFDDLFQEGWIAVWDALRTGFPPSRTVIENRMRNWVKFCRKRGFGDEADSDSELLD